MEKAPQAGIQLRVTSELAHSFAPGARVLAPSEPDALLTGFKIPLGESLGYTICWVARRGMLKDLKIYQQDSDYPGGWAHHALADQPILQLPVLEMAAASTVNYGLLVVVVEVNDGAGTVSQHLVPLKFRPDTGLEYPRAIPPGGLPAKNGPVIGEIWAANSRDGTCCGWSARSDAGLDISTIGQDDVRLSALIPYAEMPGFPQDPETPFSWDIAIFNDKRVAIVGVPAATAVGRAESPLTVWIVTLTDQEEFSVITSQRKSVVTPGDVILNLNGAHEESLEVIASSDSASALHTYDHANDTWAEELELFKGFVREARIDTASAGDGERYPYLFFGTHHASGISDLFMADARDADIDHRSPVPLGLSPVDRAELFPGAAFTFTGNAPALECNLRLRTGTQWSSHEILHSDPAVNAPIYSQDPYYEVTCKVLKDGFSPQKAAILLTVPEQNTLLIYHNEGSKWIRGGVAHRFNCDPTGAFHFRYRAVSIHSVKFEIAVIDDTDPVTQLASTSYRPDQAYIEYLAGGKPDPNPTNRHALEPLDGRGTALARVRHPLSGALLFAGAPTALQSAEACIMELGKASLDASYTTAFVLDSSSGLLSFTHLDDNEAGQLLRSPSVDSLGNWFSGVYDYLLSHTAQDTYYKISRIAVRTLSAAEAEVTMTVGLLGEEAKNIVLNVARQRLGAFALAAANMVHDAEVVVDNAYLWLCAVFDWEQIKRTQQALMAMLRDGLDEQYHALMSLKPAVAGVLKHVLDIDINKSVSRESIADVAPVDRELPAAAHAHRSEYGLSRFYSGNSRADISLPGGVKRNIDDLGGRLEPALQQASSELYGTYSRLTNTDTLNRSVIDHLVQPVLLASPALAPLIVSTADTLFDTFDEGAAWLQEEVFKDWSQDAPYVLRCLWQALFKDVPLSAANAVTLLAAFPVNITWKIEYGRDSEPFPAGLMTRPDLHGYLHIHGTIRTFLLSFFGAAACGMDEAVNQDKWEGRDVLRVLALTEASLSILDLVMSVNIYMAGSPGGFDQLLLAFAGLSTFLLIVSRFIKRLSDAGLSDILTSVLAIIIVILTICSLVENGSYTTSDIALFLAELLAVTPDVLSFVATLRVPGWEIYIPAITLVSLISSGLLTYLGAETMAHPKPMLDLEKATVKPGARATFAHEYEYTVTAPAGLQLEVRSSAGENDYRRLGTTSEGRNTFSSTYGTYGVLEHAWLRVSAGDFSSLPRSGPYTELPRDLALERCEVRLDGSPDGRILNYFYTISGPPDVVVYVRSGSGENDYAQLGRTSSTGRLGVQTDVGTYRITQQAWIRAEVGGSTQKVSTDFTVKIEEPGPKPDPPARPRQIEDSRPRRRKAGSKHEFLARFNRRRAAPRPRVG